MELETEPQNRRQLLRAVVQGEANRGRGHGGGCPVLKWVILRLVYMLMDKVVGRGLAVFEGELQDQCGKAEGVGFAVDGEEPGGTKCGKRSWGKLVLAGFDSTLLSLGPVVGMYQVPPFNKEHHQRSGLRRVQKP